MFLDVAPLLIPLIIFVLFSYLYLSSKKKAKIEEDKISLFQEQCGGRFDGFNLTFPFVRHTIYEDCILISYGPRHHSLRYEEIRGVVSKRHLFSYGISYLHSKRSVPGSITLWTRSQDTILTILRNKDVDISEM